MDQLLLPKERKPKRKLDYSKLEKAMQLAKKVEEFYDVKVTTKARTRYFTDIKAAYAIFCYATIGLSYSAIAILMSTKHDMVMYYNKQSHQKTIQRRVDEISILYSGKTPRKNVDEIIAIVEKHFMIDLKIRDGKSFTRIVTEATMDFILQNTDVNFDEFVFKIRINRIRLSGYMNQREPDRFITKKLHQILAEYVTRRNNKPS